jgi:hypothetical protein
MKIKIKYSFLILILVSIVACSFLSNNNNQNSKKRNFVTENILYDYDSISVYYDLDSLQTNPTEKQKIQLKNILDKIYELNDTIQIALYNDYKESYSYYIEGASSYKISKNDLEELFPNPAKKNKIINMYKLETIYVSKEDELNDNSFRIAYNFISDIEHEYIVEFEDGRIVRIGPNG